MLERTPSLMLTVILAILGAIGFALSYGMDVTIRSSIIGMIGVILLVAALVTGIDWIWYRAIRHYRQIKDAQMTTPQVKIMQSIQAMTAEQLGFANSLATIIRMMPGEPAPMLYAIQIGDESIPFDFCKTFVELSDNEHLPPVRQWPSGSLNRHYAEMLTNHLVLMGYAQTARGNQSATWIHKLNAMRSLGLVEPDSTDGNEMVTLNYLQNIQMRRERQRRHAALREE